MKIKMVNNYEIHLIKTRKRFKNHLMKDNKTGNIKNSFKEKNKIFNIGSIRIKDKFKDKERVMKVKVNIDSNQKNLLFNDLEYHILIFFNFLIFIH